MSSYVEKQQEYEKHINLVNSGEFDNELKTCDKPDNVFSLNAFVIGYEKIKTGTSATEKGIIKQAKKAATVNEQKSKEAQNKILAFNLELSKTQEQIEAEKDELLFIQSKQQREATEKVKQFLFFDKLKLANVLAKSKIDAVWLRDYTQWKTVIKTYGAFLKESSNLPLLLCVHANILVGYIFTCVADAIQFNAFSIAIATEGWVVGDVVYIHRYACIYCCEVV